MSKIFDADESGGRLDDLPPSTVVAVYRIVQEAINNAIRHANAARIKVALRESGGRIAIVVEDDGLGLSAAPGRRTGGLSNMQTRASLIGAELKAMPGEGGGTRLELSLPSSVSPMTEPVE